jgi:hypothetical protein
MLGVPSIVPPVNPYVKLPPLSSVNLRELITGFIISDVDVSEV